MRRSSGWLGAQHTDVKVYPTQISDAIDSRLETRVTTNARAHLAWGAGLALRRPQRDRLKISLRKEGTVLDELLETRRLTRTDGGDPAYICLVARRGGYNLGGTFSNYPASLKFP